MRGAGMWVALATMVACGGAESTIERVGINEIASGDDMDFVELLNVTDAAVDVGGWQLDSDGESYTFPAGTTVPANGYLVVWWDGSAASGEHHTEASLPDAGGLVELLDAEGALMDDVSFPSASPEQGFGRVPDAAPNWQVMEQSTPGATNG
ncbi:MAG: lamin tail domain-containing protein [Myxococcales bacterium]|nr:lamin tail domain-containing protein [Myxococcales bacterium]